MQEPLTLYVFSGSSRTEALNPFRSLKRGDKVGVLCLKMSNDQPITLV